MKSLIKLNILILIICYFSTTVSEACTSFAVYSNETYYGKNYDHITIDDMKFTIEDYSENNVSVFSLKIFIFNNYYPTVSMSDKGVFMSLNDLYPQEAIVEKIDENQVDICDFSFGVPYIRENVQEVRDYLASKEVICQYLSEHTLFADTTKDACIIEPHAASEKGYKQLDIEGKYMLMTNIANHQIGDKAYCERYNKGKEYIESHIDSFGYAEGIETLKETSQMSTRCSMLFSPQNNEVYFFLDGNADRIWKISIEDKIIETHTGFLENTSFDIDAEGVSVKKLISYEQSDYQQEKPPKNYSLYYIVGLVTVFLIIIVMRRLKK